MFTPWLKLSVDAGRLAAETQALIGLRLLRMATGTVPLVDEAQRMIPEKVAALSAAQVLVAEGAVRGKPEETAKKVVRLYRGRVKANKERLSNKPARLSRH
jgi:hypothetical protein